MGVKILFLTLALTSLVTGQSEEEICAYMKAIPRPETPEFEELNFNGVPWSQRPLLPPPFREDVCMGEYYPSTSTSGQQVILMEEEIEGEVIIAQLNYQGSATPTFVFPFLFGSYNMLLPEIRYIDGSWFLIITQRQDFETPGMQLYQFNIRVDGEALVAGVALEIVNIDDNQPIIHMLNTCTVPELEDAHLTECVYEVTDIDGEISTRQMSFYVFSDRGDDEIFYLQGENIPDVWDRMLMTVGTTRALDFETNALHIFTVQASDSLPNNATVTMMVQVENVESRPPRWVEIFAVQQFDEKTSQQFTVRAIDGDTGINRPIYYDLIRAEEDTFFSLETIEGGREGAILHVDPIDRDALERDVFQLCIVAYKSTDEQFSTTANIVIIIDDINDQRPEPLHEEYHIDIMEETAMTLDFEEFGFHDRDLGENARYSVELLDVYPPGAASAFYISPQEGYQRQTFFMGTRNHSMLDYEVPEFQNIVLQVRATDLNRTDFIGVATVYVNLINWNDEEPIFEDVDYSVSFVETVPEGFYVGTVIAHDRDIDDRVEHSLMGNAVDYLRIDQDTGEIFVSINEAFDFHRQSTLFVQVRADDTLGSANHHTTTTQLVIHLEDVNNTPPTLRLPRASPSVEENVPENYVIENGIRATDPDTTAHLVFEINWDETWATKQGRPTPEVEYRDCVFIQTVYDNDGTNLGAASGVVLVREIRPGVTIDFEEFEILYLSVRVRDLNTVLGDDYDEAIFTINIIDMNDNWPIFAEGSLQQAFRIREVSASDTVIGFVLATDIDGPLYNQVHYSIRPREDTPDGLVKIDLHSGQITVDADGAIDADEPPREHLFYTVIASDRCLLEECPPDPVFWEEEGEIEIEIIDTNNKFPVPDTSRFPTEVHVWENVTSGFEIVQLFADDIDRDELYHNVRYQINYAWNPRLRLFFEVDLDSGLLYVNYTTDEVLDRDRGEPTHTILFNLIDNFYTDGDGRRNQNETTVEIILLDVNDNAPELPDDLTWSISESVTAGMQFEPVIFAPDIDEPGTDNSRVGYRVLELRAHREVAHTDLFTTFLIENIEGNRAMLEAVVDLRGFWGNYDIHIEAYDHGIPQMASDMWYPMVIRPYNFHDPVFVFPAPGTILRFAAERATPNSVLVTADGAILQRIQATDEDGLEAGRVTFSVVGNEQAMQYFNIDNDGENLGSLILLAVPDNLIEFQITIRATDGGTEPGPRSQDLQIRAIFVPTLGEPVFENRAETVLFTEGPTGLEQSHHLSQAEDPKNYACTDDCNDIYYRIAGGNNEGLFALDPVENRLYLLSPLSREQSRTYSLVVAASNSATAAGTPLDSSTLIVTINVIEEDPRPVFVSDLYTAGISTLDSVQRELLTVHATHSLGLPLTYTIDHASMQLDPSLQVVSEDPFLLQPTSGVLTLNMQPTASMHGMFEFDVLATDLNDGVDRTQVKIYLISTRNRVYFRFHNQLEDVEASADFIAATFSAGFGMLCHVDQVVPAADASGALLADIAEVRAHFVRDDTPVPAEEIEDLRSDTLLLYQIQERLSERSLILQDLVTGASPEVAGDSQQTAVYALASLAAILALLCLILLLTFFLRTRALNRRLEALSMTKYGSQDSGLNRAGLAPGTNKHAVEGSNPIWNEAIRAPDFDNISDVSADSDLIGIEDLPQFRADYFPPGDDTSQDDFNLGQPDSVTTHNNNFGFKNGPFNPGFANSPFRR